MPNEDMQAALNGLSFHALLIIVVKILAQAGFGDVQIMDRRTTRQKSRFGGFEVLCEGSHGTEKWTIPVKVIPDAINLRMVDELAGVVQRRKASGVMIIGTQGVAKNVAKHIDSYTTRPIIWGIEELAHQAVRLGVGVRKGGGVDYAFFGQLEMVSDMVLDFLAAARFDV